MNSSSALTGLQQIKKAAELLSLLVNEHQREPQTIEAIDRALKFLNVTVSSWHIERADTSAIEAAREAAFDAVKAAMNVAAMNTPAKATPKFPPAERADLSASRTV
jgi:hypothetical protein